MESETLLIKSLQNLLLTDKSTIDTNKSEGDYILDLAVQNSSDPLIAAVYSDFTIRLMSKNGLKHSSTISGHKDTVTKVQFGQSDVHMVYSCSKDKTIRCWDTRTSTTKEVKLFQAPPAVTSEFLSLDVSHSDLLLCAGTEMVDNDSYLLFWDNRQNSLLGCYSECHQDDVTQVCFQPGSDRNLASGSADGLVCIFDLAETSEDDALQITANAESDVSRVGWCGGQNGTDCVYCVTSDNSFRVWDAQEGDNCCTVSNLSEVYEGGAVDYIVDCIPELTACSNNRSTAVLLTGSYSGHLRLLSCTDQDNVKCTLSSLDAGHTATVRCSHWDSKTQTLLTGGEDSQVCLWSPGPLTQISNKSSKAESRGKMIVTEHSRKPYNKTKK
uniref:WD repeat-containing protein 89 n=1 Tax=Arion vulgaris TaxID=1028688 RepID=A0A0B7ASG4_9EUPU